MMPVTVPSRPNKGEMLAMVPTRIDEALELVHHVAAHVFDAFHHDLAAAMTVAPAPRPAPSERRVLLQRFDDLGVHLVAVRELGDLLDELLRQHSLALQGPEAFENDTDQRDRAEDDRPHEWAAGPNDFPHGPASYRRVKLDAPPRKRIAHRTRGSERRNALRPEADLDATVTRGIENPYAGVAPAREGTGTRFGAGHAARGDREPVRRSAPVASIHSRLEPSALACRLTITTSLTSAPEGSRATRWRSPSASRSPPRSSARSPTDTRSAQLRPAGPVAKSRSQTPSHSNRASSQTVAGSELDGQPPPARMRRTSRPVASKAAPRARSALRAGRISRSTGLRPSASSAGITTRAARAPCVFQPSPVSNTRT